MLQSVQKKKAMKFSSINIFFVSLLPLIYLKVTISVSRCHSSQKYAIVRSDNQKMKTSHFMFLQNAIAIKSYYMQLVHST